MPVKHKKHILFVDDEVDLAELYQEIFIGHGFKVSLAHSAKNAIDILKKSGGEIDLIVSDFQMPGGNADLIVSFLEKEGKNLGLKSKILILSAYSNKEIEEIIH